MKKISDLVRNLRYDLKLNQLEFSRFSNIRYNIIVDIENDKYFPLSGATFEKLKNNLGIIESELREIILNSKTYKYNKK